MSSDPSQTHPSFQYDDSSYRPQILRVPLRPFCYPAMMYDSPSFRMDAEPKKGPILTYEWKKFTMVERAEPNIPRVTYTYDAATNEVGPVLPGKPASLPTLTYDGSSLSIEQDCDQPLIVRNLRTHEALHRGDY